MILTTITNLIVSKTLKTTWTIPAIFTTISSKTTTYEITKATLTYEYDYNYEHDLTTIATLTTTLTATSTYLTTKVYIHSKPVFNSQTTLTMSTKGFRWYVCFSPYSAFRYFIWIISRFEDNVRNN